MGYLLLSRLWDLPKQIFTRFAIETDTPIKCGRLVLLPSGAVGEMVLNKTGAASVKGTLITADTSTDDAAKIVTADIPNATGVVYEDGVPDGKMMIVAKRGRAQVLLEDGTAATKGYWTKVSDNQNGRCDASNQLPPGGTVQALEDHGSEIGHCLQSIGAGTDVLAWIDIHFN